MGVRFEDFNILPFIFLNPQSRVNGNFRADFNSNDLAVGPHRLDQVGEASAWAAADIERRISWLEPEQFCGALTQGLYKEKVEVRKRTDEMDEVPKIRRSERTLRLVSVRHYLATESNEPGFPELD